MGQALQKGYRKSLKDRLDIMLVQKGFFPSREKAKAAIMAGIVYVDQQRIDKAGTPVKDEQVFEVRADLCPYVSRGGLKLEKSLESFCLDLSDSVAADIGASTGGFTDCMLQKGARRVYAIDVGYGQLDYKLRIDPRVVNMEKENVRYLDPSRIPEKLDFISIDVSFISLKHIFPVAADLLKPDGGIICLIKPQFEAGREQVGKNGIVRDSSIHKEVIQKVLEYGTEFGLYPHGLTFSPVTGAKGNIEYLLYLKKQVSEGFEATQKIGEVVEASHHELEKNTI